MKTLTFWESTTRLSLITIFYFMVVLIYWYRGAPELINPTVIFLVLSIIGFALLQTSFKKPSRNVVGIFFISFVILITISILMNQQHFVENFDVFEPYFVAKLLAISIALSAPPKLWVGWMSLFIVGLAPVIQYYSWPPFYRSQLGAQEPTMTIAFVIVAAVLYINRLRTLTLLKKEVIATEKLTFIQRLGGLMVGLQHLNNTPLQTMEISLELMREKCPECLSIIESMDRSYHSIVRVNKLLATGSQSVSQNSASTIEEFAEDVQGIREYLRT